MMNTLSTEHDDRRLLGRFAESRAFGRMRRAVLSELARQAFKISRVQAISILFSCTLLWCGLFVLFIEGFQFIQSELPHPGIRTQLVQTVFNVFFLALTAMLFYSSAIITYGTMYRGEEVAFLLTHPVSSARITMHKFQETLFFSCWGFVLLGSPMLLAYGLVAGSPWYYFALLLPFIVSFVYIPAGLGTIACMLVVRLLPRIRMHVFIVFAGLTLAATGIFGWRVLAYENQDVMSPTWFQDVLSRLEFSEQRLLPSWWLSSGLLEAAHPVESFAVLPSWLESLLFLSVLLSNALLLQLVLAKVAAATLRPGYGGLADLSRTKRLASTSRFDRVFLQLLWPLPRDVRHFVLKDLRLFRRDPLQWSQLGIFLALLSLYFFNVRRFDYAGSMARWVLIMSFMNLAVVGLILSTFTTRFIFPMVSLEGRRFWVLGTAPINRNSVLWGKFLFACVGALPTCAGLVLISDIMLRVAEHSPWIVVVHQISCWVLCVGLSALAVGLGARLPNLREPSPSKIAAGFGGTLNLVLSSLYIIAVVLATAVPCVLWNFDGPAGRRGWWFGGMFGLGTTGSVAIGMLITLVLGGLATYLPLRSGFRAFRRLEV